MKRIYGALSAIIISQVIIHWIIIAVWYGMDWRASPMHNPAYAWTAYAFTIIAPLICLYLGYLGHGRSFNKYAKISMFFISGALVIFFADMIINISYPQGSLAALFAFLALGTGIKGVVDYRRDRSIGGLADSIIAILFGCLPILWFLLVGWILFVFGPPVH